MPAQTSGEAERLLRLVAEAESLCSVLDPFKSGLLGELGRLVPADRVAYNELDRVRRRNHLLDKPSPSGRKKSKSPRV